MEHDNYRETAQTAEQLCEQADMLFTAVDMSLNRQDARDLATDQTSLHIRRFPDGNRWKTVISSFIRENNHQPVQLTPNIQFRHIFANQTKEGEEIKYEEERYQYTVVLEDTDLECQTLYFVNKGIVRKWHEELVTTPIVPRPPTIHRLNFPTTTEEDYKNLGVLFARLQEHLRVSEYTL